jgi:hypothetical protein
MHRSKLLCNFLAALESTYSKILFSVLFCSAHFDVFLCSTVSLNRRKRGLNKGMVGKAAIFSKALDTPKNSTFLWLRVVTQYAVLS